MLTFPYPTMVEILVKIPRSGSRYGRLPIFNAYNYILIKDSLW